MRKLSGKRKARRGFSLIEAMISTFIFLSVLGAIYGALSSGRSFAGVENTLAKIQMDARKVLDRVGGELRMAGWLDHATEGELPYPYVFVNGVAYGAYASESHAAPAQHVPATSGAFGQVREIVFKIPRDLDGDGMLTDAATGAVEWSTQDVSYVLITDAGGVNTLVRREDGVITDYIARYVERITFDTITTDATVAMNEIAITVYMARPAPGNKWLETSLSTCVTMRNVDDAS